MANGFVYILINPAMPGLLKIGKTTGSPEARAAELSAVTGLPTPFVVACEWNTFDCDAAESQVHARLEASRYNKDREFFRLPLKEAIKIASEICQQFETRHVDQGAKPSGPSGRPATPSGKPATPSGKPPARLFRTYLTRTYPAKVSCRNCQRTYSVTMKYPEQEVVCPHCHNRQLHPVTWEPAGK